MRKHRNLRQGFGEVLAVCCLVLIASAVLHGLHSPPARKPIPVKQERAGVSSGPRAPEARPVSRPAPVPAREVRSSPRRAPAPVVSPPSVPLPVVVAPGTRAQPPRIALVIDDWGYTSQNLSLARRMNFPVTAAVIPRLALSAKVAEELHALGFEIILHLPMEPHEHKNLEKNTIMTTWKPRKIESVIEQALASVKYARGVNNHMGSKATADRQTMESVISYLSGKGLYFLDSYVSAESLGLEIAREYGVSGARRDVFIDNSDDPADIRAQLAKLRKKAVETGAAIGIGHDRPATLEVLLEEVPKLQEEGVAFVYVSQMTE